MTSLFQCLFLVQIKPGQKSSRTNILKFEVQDTFIVCLENQLAASKSFFHYDKDDILLSLLIVFIASDQSRQN